MRQDDGPEIAFTQPLLTVSFFFLVNAAVKRKRSRNKKEKEMMSDGKPPCRQGF